MRPIAGKEQRITKRAVELARESDERLLSMLARFRSPNNAHLRTDPETRQAVRRVLRVRGYVFDRQTGAMLAKNPVVVGSVSPVECIIVDEAAGQRRLNGGET